MRDLFASKVPVRGPKNEKHASYLAAVSYRHSCILILCSLILSYPYSIPQFLVEVLVTLAKHVSDPSPIQEAIRSTFRDFKRTHQDSWEHDKKIFKEDELYTISDLLISPSYYA
jgi:proteasome activator subunit 4